MARIVLVVLACYAVQAEDYGGGSMPQYAAPDYEARAPSLEDYRGHAPDAVAPLDYKYEEQPSGDTGKSSHYIGDMDSTRWRRPSKKQKRRQEVRNKLELHGTEEEADIIPKHKFSRRHPKAKSQNESEKPRIFEESRSRRQSRYRKHAPEEGDRIDYIEHIDYRDRNKFSEDDDILQSITTERVHRRKPRDRGGFAPPPPIDTKDLEDEDMNLDQNPMLNKVQSQKTYDDADEEASERALPPARFRGSDDEAQSISAISRKDKDKYKGYQDYHEYYDMKRLENAKLKLPTLLRRTTTTAPARTSAIELAAALWPARRAGVADATTISSKSTTPSTTTTAVTNQTVTKANATAPKIQPTTIKSPQELSIAEKSRLSILKKALMKESVKSGSTKKPPVLMQVTRNLATVVMVEPPTPPDPWMRARLVSDESDEHIEKVKKLMRQKLVAGAKDIRELTENWDEMVCDYIDVALLDEAFIPRPDIVCFIVAFVASFVM